MYVILMRYDSVVGFIVHTSFRRLSIIAGPRRNKPPKMYVADDPTHQKANFILWKNVNFPIASKKQSSTYLLTQQLARGHELKHQVTCKFPALFLFDRFGHIPKQGLSCMSPQMPLLILITRSNVNKTSIKFIRKRTLTNSEQNHSRVQKFSIAS